MIRILWGCLLGVGLLFSAQVVAPVQQIKVGGIVKDMVLRGNNLVIGTDSGKVEVYDYLNKKIVKTIMIPDIKDFTGETMHASVFSVDYQDGRYLLLSDSGVGGYSNLWLHENNRTIQLISPKDQKVLMKVRFTDKSHILFGYLSNEAALYDIDTKKEYYHVALQPSKFSDFALNEDRTKAAFSCESGAISVIRVNDGKVLRVLKSINKDNVYKVAFRDDTVVGAGEDRRAAIYHLSSGEGDFIRGKFLIYATALSPSADKVAFAMDEENNIYVYKTSTKRLIALLKGAKSTLNTIVFKDEKSLFSSSDDNVILQWEL